ncbi:hypothetical protein GQ43DRAFT_279302 [Delitschia confertaspora ATCC 74209]|uniref:Acetyltransferase, GNAT family n=1 Tax=Delitschia confertaspora ATCC 74209 TaxID=1513339 RepID=A0A9P4JVC0_9PLEO|nr:hypothetical protein GQ43DRAFT_279302 [Delitschia confertaspora ATCC 74209]
MMSEATGKPEIPSIRLATLSDIPAIARCWYEAFFDDVVIGEIMHPNRKQYPEDVYYFLLRGIRERFFDWTHQFVVAVIKDGNGEKVVGAADWRRLGEGGRARELSRVDPRNLLAPTLSLINKLSLFLYPNRAADPTRTAFLTSAVEDSKRFWTGERAECWDLYVCGVHPEWQSKGVGLKLVGWGTERADEEAVVCSVITGDSKRGFYGRKGFVRCGNVFNSSVGERKRAWWLYQK